MADLLEFHIIPVLGRRVDVPQDDPSLFQGVNDNTFLTHDVGGINFDLTRKRNACAKANGYSKWSRTANAQATKCLGLYELYDGTNRNHLYVDNGAVYNYDSNRDPAALTDAVLGFTSCGVVTIGATLTEVGGDGSGVLARYEVTSGTFAGTNAAGNFYLQTVSGTWSDDARIITSGSGVSVGTVDGTLSTTTFANDNEDLYSMIKIGEYWAFVDRGENIPHKWKHGDQRLTPLDATGEYTTGAGDGFKFRYLVNFARRAIGLYCENDTNAGNISVHWSTAWPDTQIADLNFSSANQLYIPNDDPITGGATMGTDKCFIYCENSIQQFVYYPDYESPFQCFTVVPQRGSVNHQGIVNLGDRHMFFNREDGFSEYQGGRSTLPISLNLDPDIQDMIWDFAHLMVGTYIPTMRCAAWTVPMVANETPNRLLFFHVDTRQWWWMDRSFRYIDYWQAYADFTWIDLIRDLGGLNKSSGTADTNTASHLVDSGASFITDGVVIGDEAYNTTDGTYANVTAVAATDLTLDSDVFPDGDENYEVGTGKPWSGVGSNSWAYYASLASYLVGGNTDGHLYNQAGESIPGTDNLNGYRIEPILDFGDSKRKDLIEEIWFSISFAGEQSIDVYHRGGNTSAEVTGSGWELLGSVSSNKPDRAVLHLSKSARLHQIKWGMDLDSEYFEVSKITFKFRPQSEH